MGLLKPTAESIVQRQKKSIQWMQTVFEFQKECTACFQDTSKLLIPEEPLNGCCLRTTKSNGYGEKQIRNLVVDES